MEKSYCQFSNSGGSWLSFPEPEDDSESEGITNSFSALKFSQTLHLCRCNRDSTCLKIVCYHFLGENNNGLEARHATLLPKNGNCYDML